jgi:hypothetical protein
MRRRLLFHLTYFNLPWYLRHVSSVDCSPAYANVANERQLLNIHTLDRPDLYLEFSEQKKNCH